MPEKMNDIELLTGRMPETGNECIADSAIVDGIANVFPFFFYAVAALVCITTMNRMIEEQRTQIGVLKARVLLERIPFVWKRMKFLHKVSYRNKGRYDRIFEICRLSI